ncbi:MAG TPA: DNA-processing protein DprA, partial [Mycobacterium sp.]|nr:DNA-processing protein DprA [Mycobacterium sp.]
MIAPNDELVALLALLDERPALRDERAGATSWSTIASEVSLRGSAVVVWEQLHAAVLDGSAGRGGPLERARKLLARWRGSDFALVTVLDEGYPLALRGIHQLPPVLFYRGRLVADEVGVSVVGSRRPSERGLAIASHVAAGL